MDEAHRSRIVIVVAVSTACTALPRLRMLASADVYCSVAGQEIARLASQNDYTMLTPAPCKPENAALVAHERNLAGERSSAQSPAPGMDAVLMTARQDGCLCRQVSVEVEEAVDDVSFLLKGEE